MKKELFREYATIKNKIKLLTEEAKSIETEVKGEMIKEDVEQVKSDFGTFSIVSRKSWTYSPKVIELEASLKKIKEVEVEEGVATSKISTSLMFRNK